MTELAGTLRARYAGWVDQVAAAGRHVCGDELLGAVVFGSVGRDRPHEGSDIDLMMVVQRLPEGRRPRSELAAAIEAAALQAGPDLPDVALVLRTPREIEDGFPLLLDMIEDGRNVWDPHGTVAMLLDGWRTRLAAHGARRVRTGESWHWDLAGSSPPGRWTL